MLSAEKGLFYLRDVYTNLMKTTEHKSRAEALNIKKKETEKNIIENHQTKLANRNTRKKKQWRYRTTRKQKMKWQY